MVILQCDIEHLLEGLKIYLRLVPGAWLQLTLYAGRCCPTMIEGA